MKSIYTRSLSSFKKWRERITSKDWHVVVSVIKNAETHPKTEGIGWFKILLEDTSFFACKKRFYIKKHLQRYKQQRLKTG